MKKWNNNKRGDDLLKFVLMPDITESITMPMDIMSPKAIGGVAWLSFASHGAIENITTAILTDIIDYIIGLGSNSNCYV